MRILLVCGALVSAFCTGPASAAEPATTVRLLVNVQDRSGKPIAKPRAALFKTTPQGGRALRREANLVIGKQGQPILGSTEGVIETSPLSNKQAYVLEIDAEGFAPELSRWIPANQSGTIEVPAVKLRRDVEIRGLVTDRHGRPVSNVVVIQAGDGPKRLETVADQRGQFVLQGVPEGRSIVCFDAPGFRFFGTVITAPAQDARIELERAEEPNSRLLKRDAALTRQLSVEQRSAAARQLVDPILSAVLAKKVVEDADYWKLLIAARLEPKRLLARVNDLKFSRPFRQEQLRITALFSLSKDGKPDELMQAVARLESPETRINAYLYWFQTNPQIRANRSARREGLKKARDLIAAAKDVRSRGFWLSELGSQLWAIGDHAEARKAFDECRILLKTMPDGAQGKQGIRFTLAMAVARENAKEAKELAGDLEPGQMMRLAGEVAREHPQEVEALLAPVRSELSLMQLSAVGNNLPRLCYRVALKDPTAAERILVKFARPPQAQSDAESVFGLGGTMFGNFSKELIDFQVRKVKAVCLGLIAEAAVKRNPAAARQALLQAVEIVRPMRTGFVHPATQFYNTPSGLMMTLVPVAERVDRALANELFWRALSLKISLSGESADRMSLDTDTSERIDIVSFYNRSLATDLLEPLLSRTISRSYSGMRTFVWPIRSLVLLDPDRATKFPNSLCEQASWDGSLPREVAIQAIANVLAITPAQDAVDGGLKSALSALRNSYGVYVDMDDEDS